MSLALALIGFCLLLSAPFDGPRAKKLTALGLFSLVVAGWVGGYLWPLNG